VSVSLGIVTVTHNSGEILRTFLASAAEAARYSSRIGSTRIAIADNASATADADRAGEITGSFGADFLRLTSNRGYGAGITSAINAISGHLDYVLVSNPDVVMHQESLDRLIECAERRPDGGVFGPRIVDATGATYPSARTLPSLRTGIGHALFGRVWPANPWTRAYRLDLDSSEEREAGWVSGACLLVRKDAFDQIGGFDDNYFMYFEDVDLGERMGRAGWKNVYVPSAVVTHTGAHSTSQSSKFMERVHHQSAYRYLSRKYSAWYLAPLRLVLRIGLATRSWWVTR
jgi:N-acetylglucosaminyl-diphospho-decaprenol L-rhamnosyltransferase